MPEGSPRPRILIVGADWLTASAIHQALEKAGHVVSDVVSSSEAALALASREVPDLAVVGIPAAAWEEGVDLVQRLHADFGVPSVVVTDADGLARVIGMTAAGIVVKPFHKGQLLSAVAVARPRTNGARSAEPSVPVAPTPSDRTPKFHEVARALAERVNTRRVLTRRELEVVRLLMANERVRTIAERLQVSPSTVRNQLRSVFRKLDVHSQGELIQGLKEQQL